VEHYYRGVINGKAGKAAALPTFSDTLTLSLSRGADYTLPLALPHLKFYLDYAPVLHTYYPDSSRILLPSESLTKFRPEKLTSNKEIAPNFKSPKFDIKNYFFMSKISLIIFLLKGVFSKIFCKIHCCTLFFIIRDLVLTKDFDFELILDISTYILYDRLRARLQKPKNHC
jgi:hypothetical protein